MNTLKTTYKSLDELPIWNFYEILKTSDYTLLGEEGDETLWYKLYDAYYKKSEMRMPDFKIIQRIQRLVIKHRYLGLLLYVLESDEANRHECKKKLKEFGYKYDDSVSLELNLVKFESDHDVLFTKIQILSQEIPQEAKEHKTDIWDEVAVLRKHFQQAIDPKTTVCSEWISLKKQMQKDVKASRLNSNKGSKRRT